MEQRITFIASVVVDEDGHNWVSGRSSVADILEDGSWSHHEGVVHRVIKLENVELLSNDL